LSEPTPIPPERAPAALFNLAARTAVVGLVVALIASLVLMAWRALPALVVIFCGFLIALLLSGLADAISRRSRLGYRVSLAVGGLAVLLGIAGILWFVGDGLVRQMQGLGTALPEGLSRAGELVRGWVEGLGMGTLPELADVVPSAGTLVSGAMGVVGSAVGILGSALFALLLGVFFAATPETYRRGMLHLIPRGRRARIDEIATAVARGVHKWLLSRLAIMALTFCTSYIGLALIGVPFAGGLAVLSALVVFVPYVGPYISGSAAALVALLDGPQTALYTIAFYIGVESLQGWTIEPIIEARATSAPAGLLLSAQLVLGLLLGALGVVLASPLAVAATVMVQMLYVQDALGDEVRVLGEPARAGARPPRPADV